jgi:hypothetical protein
MPRQSGPMAPRNLKALSLGATRSNLAGELRSTWPVVVPRSCALPQPLGEDRRHLLPVWGHGQDLRHPTCALFRNHRHERRDGPRGAEALETRVGAPSSRNSRPRGMSRRSKFLGAFPRDLLTVALCSPTQAVAAHATRRLRLCVRVFGRCDGAWSYTEHALCKCTTKYL